jgi:hypothetical protein
MLKCTDIFAVVEKPTDQKGLTKEIKFAHEYVNTQDWVQCDYDYLHSKIEHEFSEKDKQVLKASMEELSQKKLNLVVEIGIARSNEWSSTYFLLNNKSDSTTYLGIDTNPVCKSFVDSWKKPNTHARVIDSSDSEAIYAEIRALGFEEIDLLIIDGNHSADQIYKDFRLADFVRKGGIILFHDTNYHPGPMLIFRCIDPAVYHSQLFYEGEEDWGVGILKKL